MALERLRPRDTTQGLRQSEHDFLLAAHDLDAFLPAPFAQPSHNLLHESLGRRGAGGEAQGLHAFEPREVDLAGALESLYSRGIRQVFVEGGAQIQSNLIRLGLADEFLIYLAPKLIGGSHNAVRDIDVNTISDAVQLRFLETKHLGEDILIRAIHKEK